MTDQKDLNRELLAQWAQQLTRYDLPDWDRLPQLDLYMDQVVILLTQYLQPMTHGEDKAVTASIINNYVRMKIMPPPVKKRYSRVHLAYLIIICLLKQSLSISCIQRLLPADPAEATVRDLYEDFVRQFRDAAAAFARHVPASGEFLLPVSEGNLAAAAAIFSTLAKDLTEFLLQSREAAPEV